MRFVDKFDWNITPLPVCQHGTDLSISFYIFNKWYGGDPREQHLFQSYIHEAIMAYRQLIHHTNILDCGRVRFFVDAKCADRVLPVFQAAGIEQLLVWIDVARGIQLSGYIPYLDHESVEPCRYRFHCDSDFWWCAPKTNHIFDWQALCNLLDQVPGNHIFGKEIYKRNIDYVAYFGQHLPTMEENMQRAKEIINKLYCYRPPEHFRKIIETPLEELELETDVSPLESVAGWFLGFRKDSQALRTLQECWELIGHDIVSDEGFIAVLLHNYPEICIHDIFYDASKQNPYPIFEFALDNIFQTTECGVLNVGSREVTATDELTAQKLERIFNGIRTSSHRYLRA